MTPERIAEIRKDSQALDAMTANTAEGQILINTVGCDLDECLAEIAQLTEERDIWRRGVERGANYLIDNVPDIADNKGLTRQQMVAKYMNLLVDDEFHDLMTRINGVTEALRTGKSAKDVCADIIGSEQDRKDEETMRKDFEYDIYKRAEEEDNETIGT